MTHLQLNPPLPLDTPKGKGWAHVLIDYSQDHHVYFLVFIAETGEPWIFSGPEVRLQPNASLHLRDPLAP